MTPTPAQRCAQLAASAIDKLIEIGIPMDPMVAAEVEQRREPGPDSTADLIAAASTLICSMAAGRPEYAPAVAALVPLLSARAERLREQHPPNLRCRS